MEMWKGEGRSTARSAMPFTCACFCGLNGYCRGRGKKKKERVLEEEEEGEKVERGRDQETVV
ncbi:uncharacterized protein [Clinocottus analis]|uniref:uncharacterized protein n=1 Tax=Clinocottus analis TaxID=304258 RepID=UPI0035C15501